ncbi:MAG TPA: tetratricopeptide repeat protein, partial [Casimicrobiaceae bacterium]|nr:tetratricopeptide repeat protein [Casimicrobiaceae bacterium]
MNRSAVTRKLAAILIADVVGFSRHMERDDGGTFARLREIRERIVDPKIAEHGGRIVKTAGDGMLLEFGSADAALRCAIDVQRAMHADNQSKPLDQRIEFRIGINLGDIIVDGTDIAGDGVNVASRLEALAEPGGICVSSAVREQVHGSLDVGFDDIGEQQVKNIMRPIRVFAVALDSTAASHSAGDQTNSRGARAGSASRASTRQALLHPRSAWAVALLALVAIGLVLFWWNARVPNVAGAPAMSVGVLPLIAPVGNAGTTQRADSLTRDLSAQLARADVAIRVVPMTTRQGSPRNSGDVAQALNVRYVLEGEVQPRQEVTEIRLRLINGASEEQIWNETVSLKEPATAPEQMRASRTAMEHVRNRLFEVEMQRATVAGERATTPMDYVLRARAMAKADKTLERFTRQEALCEEALRLNPDFVPALLCVSYTLDGQLDVDSKIDRARVIRRMDEVTNRAVNLNRGAPDAWSSRSGALMYMGRWDAALEANATAIQLDPDAAWLVAARAWSMSMVGRPDEAVALVAQAIAMDPPGEWWTIRAGCEAHLLLGQYDQAIAACEKAAGRTGEDFDIAYFLAAAYAHTGATAKALEETAKILRGSPGFTIAKLRAKQ